MEKNSSAPFFRDMLNHPLRVLVIGIIFFLGNILLNGSWLQLWRLKDQETRLSQSIGDLYEHNESLGIKIGQARQLEFIERAARDQLDLVHEGDLVFVFAGEETAHLDR